MGGRQLILAETVLSPKSGFKVWPDRVSKHL